MSVKVKGGAIKESSVPMSALSEEIKEKIENAGVDSNWNAKKGTLGYIENKTHYFNPNSKVQQSAWVIDDTYKNASISLNKNYIYKFELDGDTHYFKTDEDINSPKCLVDNNVYKISLVQEGENYILTINHSSENLTTNFITVYGNDIETSSKYYKQLSDIFISDNIARQEYVKDQLDNKQDILVSGENIKTINKESIIGKGDIEIKTATSKDITIAGGPLADYAKVVYPDGIIPLGTTFQDLFMSLFCKEIYPAATVDEGKCVIEISTPSITAKDSLNNNISNNSLIEIGSVVTINEVKANSVSKSNSTTKPTISGLTYGYSDTINGDIIKESSISKDWKNINQKDGEKYQLIATISKFSGNKPSDVSSSDVANCKLSSCSLTVVSGENTYSVKEIAPKYVCSHDGISEKFIVSNLGNRNDENKTNEIKSKTNEEISATNKTNTFKVIGVYPIFTNGVESYIDDAAAAAQPSLDSAQGQSKFKLINVNTNSDVTIAISFAKHALAPYTLWIPTVWKLKQAWRLNGSTGKWNTNEDTNNFVKGEPLTITIQGNDVEYNVYEWSAAEGANKVKITIGENKN